MSKNYMNLYYIIWPKIPGYSRCEGENEIEWVNISINMFESFIIIIKVNLMHGMFAVCFVFLNILVNKQKLQNPLSTK